MIKVIDGEGGTFALKNNLFLDHVLTGLQTLCFWTEKQSIAPNENNNNNNNNNNNWLTHTLFLDRETEHCS